MSETKNEIKKPKTLFDKVWEKHVIRGSSATLHRFTLNS